jgi:hypothetical protein
MTESTLENQIYDISKIYIKRSKTTGKGVFAKTDIVEGDIIERFPLMPTQFRTRYQGDPSILMNSFIKQCSCSECSKHGYVIYMGFGYSCLYDFKPHFKVNATYKINYDEFFGDVIATTNISKDSEIAIDIAESHYYTQAIAKATQESNENRSEY